MGKTLTVSSGTSTTTGTTLPPALSKKDFAALWGVCPRTVSNWLASGCPHYRLSPRMTKVPTRDAEQWLRDKFLVQSITIKQSPKN